MYGCGTEPWLISAARALAGLLPAAALRAVEGTRHSVAAEMRSRSGTRTSAD
jgi:hypothetical protein